MGQMDFFFNYGSTYSYLTIMRIEDLAARAGVSVRWRPFNVRTLFVEQNNIPFRDKPAKAAYMWRDIERRAARFGIQWGGIPPYPVDRSGLSNRIGIIASDEGWAGDYTKAAYRAWFLEHKDFGVPEIAAVALKNIGKEPNSIIARADSDHIHQKFAEQTDKARSLGIFGVPTFVVGNEIFWGDDRLEDALEWAQQSAAQHAG